MNNNNTSTPRKNFVIKCLREAEKEVRQNPEVDRREGQARAYSTAAYSLSTIPGELFVENGINDLTALTGFRRGGMIWRATLDFSNRYDRLQCYQAIQEKEWLPRDDFALWLETLGLSRYERTFRRQGYERLEDFWGLGADHLRDVERSAGIVFRPHDQELLIAASKHLPPPLLYNTPQKKIKQEKEVINLLSQESIPPAEHETINLLSQEEALSCDPKDTKHSRELLNRPLKQELKEETKQYLYGDANAETADKQILFGELSNNRNNECYELTCTREGTCLCKNPLCRNTCCVKHFVKKKENVPIDFCVDCYIQAKQCRVESGGKCSQLIVATCFNCKIEGCKTHIKEYKGPNSAFLLRNYCLLCRKKIQDAHKCSASLLCPYEGIPCTGNQLSCDLPCSQICCKKHQNRERVGGDVWCDSCYKKNFCCQVCPGKRKSKTRCLSCNILLCASHKISPKQNQSLCTKCFENEGVK